MRKKTTIAAVFLIAAIVLGLSVFVMPGCSSSDNTNNDNVIQGTVTAADSGAKLEGVTVSVDDNSTTTDSNGFYKLTGFVGGRHIIKASKDGYGNYSAEVIVSSWQPTTHNISLTGNTGETKVLGTVTDGTWNATGIEGVTVTVGGKSATTDSDGKYEITGIEVKNMTLTATKEGYVDYSADIDVAEGVTTTHNIILPLKPDAMVPFLSKATNFTTLLPTPSPIGSITPTPSNIPQVYVRNKYEGTTEPVSFASPGVLVPGRAYDPSISANGRYVVFNYYGLVSGSPGTSEFQDSPGVFVYDRVAGTTDYLSKNSSGEAADSGASARYLNAISADGRYVVFSSSSTNLVDDDTNGYSDIFLVDREEGTIKKVSHAKDGSAANNSSYNACISKDGHYVAFRFYGTNMVDGTNVTNDRIYLYNVETEEISIVSVNSNGEIANGYAQNSGISADGRYVIFESGASNLATSEAGTSSIGCQIYVHDTVEGTTTLVSTNSSGETANNSCYYPSISNDGNYVSFRSQATNLANGLTGSNFQVFARNLTTGVTTLVTKSAEGAEGNGNTYVSQVSNESESVIFESNSSNLVENDTNLQYDVFIHYLKTGVTERLSVSSSGEEGNYYSYFYWD